MTDRLGQLLALALVFGAPITRADLVLEDLRIFDKRGDYVGLVEYRLVGRITDKDVQQLSKALAQVEGPSKGKALVTLHLASPGGDVHAAIALGRMLRARSGLAQVLDGDECASACVFVLVGAVSRGVFGKVLIHRPYVPLDSLTTPSQQKQKYAELRTSVGKYIEEMNVPISLFDDMLRFPPESAKLLTEAELDRYGLGADDPYHDEATAVRNAKARGISRAEYARRVARGKEVCDESQLTDDFKNPAWKEWVACKDDVMAGRR